MTSRAVICGIQKINVLITDNGIPADARAEFERRGVRILIVGL
jgi:DeoR/GlpR family transcriptional regulator of sugar metabolism